MGWLADELAAVNATLTAADDLIKVHTFVPERLVPPAAVISFGSPLLEDGEVFGDMLVRHNIALVPMTATNETITNDLIAMVEIVVSGLIEDGYSVENVGKPYMLAANNANYLAVDIAIVGLVRPN